MWSRLAPASIRSWTEGNVRVRVSLTKNGPFKNIEEQLIVGRVLPPDHPLSSLQVSSRSSIGIRRPREEWFIRFPNQAGARAVPD